MHDIDELCEDEFEGYVGCMQVEVDEATATFFDAMDDRQVVDDREVADDPEQVDNIEVVVDNPQLGSRRNAHTSQPLYTTTTGLITKHAWKNNLGFLLADSC